MYCKQQGKAAKYVQKKILSALLCLMEHFSFEEITITQVCQEAQISRASFYRNYDNKENALLHNIEQLTENFKQDSEQDMYNFQKEANSPKTSAEHLFHLWFQFIFDNQDFFKLLSKNHLFYMFQQVGISPNDDSFYIRHLYTVYHVPELNKYLFNCVISAQYSMVEQWVANGCQENVNQMAKLMTNLFSNMNPGWVEFYENYIKNNQ